MSRRFGNTNSRPSQQEYRHPKIRYVKEHDEWGEKIYRLTPYLLVSTVVVVIVATVYLGLVLTGTVKVCAGKNPGRGEGGSATTNQKRWGDFLEGPDLLVNFKMGVS